MKFARYLLLFLASFAMTPPARSDSMNDLKQAIINEDVVLVKSYIHNIGYIENIELVKLAARSANHELFAVVVDNYPGNIDATICEVANSVLAGVEKKISRDDIIGEKRLSVVRSGLNILEALTSKKQQAMATCGNKNWTKIDFQYIKYYGFYPLYNHLIKNGLRLNVSERDDENPIIILNGRFLYGKFSTPLSSRKSNTDTDISTETLDYANLLFANGARIPKYFSNKLVWSADPGDRCRDFNLSIVDFYKILNRNGLQHSPSEIERLLEKRKEIEENLKGTSSPDWKARYQCRLNVINSYIDVVTGGESRAQSVVANKKINESLSEAARDLASAGFAKNKETFGDAKRRILFFLGKSGDPSIEPFGGNYSTVTEVIIEYGDTELVAGLLSRGVGLMKLNKDSANRSAFIEFAIQKNREDIASFLIEQKIRPISDINEMLATAANKRYRALARRLLEIGSSPESAIAKVANDETSVVVITNAVGGDRGNDLMEEYKKERVRQEQERERVRKIQLAERDRQEQERAKLLSELSNRRKNVGDKVCITGKVLIFFKTTVSAFVEDVRGDKIKLRIVDTEGQDIRYANTDLRQNTVIWDDFRNWISCTH